MQIKDVPSIADVDPRFVALRPDMRAEIARAEREFRKATADLIAKFPPELAENLQIDVLELPSRFIQAMYPFFHGISAMTEFAESAMQAVQQAGLVD